MKNNLLLSGAFCALTFFASCSDDDIPAIEYQEQGFVKGQITGTASDDATAIDEDFSYSKYNPGYYDGPYASNYIINDNGSIEINIVRQDVQNGGGVQVNLELDGPGDTSPSYSIELTYIRETDKILYFSTDTDSDNESDLVNFSFDATSGRVKGEFTIEGSDNSTNNDATVTGSFDAVVKQIIQ